MSKSSSITQKMAHLALMCSLVFVTGVSNAQDTEIYFSGGTISASTDQSILPNVLFILDTSGSMANDLSGDPSGRSRIEVLRESMATIIQDINNVNLGLMRFTQDNGGPVLFPITYIDTALTDVVSETETNQFTENAVEDGEEITATDTPLTTGIVGTVSLTETTHTIANVAGAAAGGANATFIILSDDNDAEEDTDNGKMNSSSKGIDSIDLDFNNDTLNGVRFTFSPGTIPRCTTLTNATLTLERASGSGNMNYQVWGQNSDSTNSFQETKNNISSRPDTAKLSYTHTGGDLVADVTTIVNSIIGRNCGTGTWDESSLVLFLERTSGNYYEFDTRDAGGSDEPQLDVSFASAAQPDTEKLFAVRFDDIDIPAGATVANASICFNPTTTASGGTQWTFAAEASADSAALSTSTGLAGLSARALAPVSTAIWNVPTFTNSTKICSDDADFTGTGLAAVMQAVAAQTNWCGGNAMTLFITANNDNNRAVESIESAIDAIELTYEYNKSSANGCYSASDSKQAGVSADDAQQNGTGATTDINETQLPIGEQITGYRFEGVNVPKNATITSATLTFRSNATVASGNAIVNIRGELPSDGDADSFAFQINNISGRTKTSDNVNWTLPANLADEESFTTVSLIDIVDAIVSNANWAAGKAMAFILEPTTTDTDYAVHARDGNASKAAKLEIVYESTGDTDLKTVRERMVELVEDLPAGDHTPILETLLEATRYWRGDTMLYGYERDGQSDTRLSHPGSYCTGPGACGNAVENSSAYSPATDAYGVQTPNGCNPDVNLDDYDCRNREIKGSNINYISPFDTDSTCQSNYQILLTDGEIYDGSDSNPDTKIVNDYGANISSSNTNLTKNNSCFQNNSTFKLTGESSLSYDLDGSHVQECTVDMVEFLNEVDQNTTLDNNQTVKTYTVAFDLTDTDATQYLKDIANLGGGTFNSANNATDLVDIFQTFLAEVRDVPTSFVAPSLATNAFNRLLSRDEIYFGLFTPQNDIRWPGNAKKFNICIDTDDGCSLGEILDSTGASAIDTTDDRFFDSSRSHWSSINDGGLTTVGGAGSKIIQHYETGTTNDSTKVYTEIGGDDTAAPVALASGDSLNQVGYVYEESGLNTDNWSADDLAVMRDQVCTTPSQTSGTDCEDRMKWLLGKKIVTEDDDISTNQRWSVTDVLHSSPSIITYGGTDSDADGVIDIFFDKLIYGTNDGALHMVNPSDASGKEDWRYIPFEFLNQQQSLFDNPEGTHTYGLDSTPVLRVVDHNKNGVIELPDSGGNNDKIHVYNALRRGGNSLYALDLSQQMANANTEIVPKFLWKIDGDTTAGYSRLAQTWSRPVLADIQTASGVKTVLIYGGGYDTGIDTATAFGTAASSGNDNDGNAIYITDADTGTKILSISGLCSSCTVADAAEIDIKVAEMQFSIPSRVTVLDSNGDGLDDRIYVGDTGGQVWRVDLATDLDTNTPGNTVVGRLASIADSSSAAGYRRFFEPPSVVQVKDTTFANGIGSEYDYVLIGSGYRAHPLNEDTEERFYAFRDTWINGMNKQVSNNEAADYPLDGASAGGDGVPIGHTVSNQLVDVTTQTLQDAVDASIDVGNALGWFFDFNDSNTVSGTVTTPGEKVLSAPITLAGTVFFTTYVPGASADGSSCEGVEIGAGRAYNFDILTTRATIDWDSTGDPVTGRVTSLGGGIPSDVVPVFTEEGVVGIVGVEGGATQLGALTGLPRFRTYWFEES